MQVVDYLKQHGLAKLQEEFAIRVKEYPEGLIVLNYDQIDSPKAHPIVMECRGLILDKEFNVVSRSFDRFFNFSEQPDTQAHIDMSKAVCYDKIDGSLIKIYHWNNAWHISTRGTAFAEMEVNGFGVTFRDLVFRALDIYDEEQFQSLCNIHLDKEVTYIFECTSMENRVVTRYEGYQLHYLAARNNSSFAYVDAALSLLAFGCVFPKQYRFDSTEACVETASQLKNLAEGYVLYQDGRPVCKIKSPAYCAVHLLRGEGLNPKRIAELVLTGEQEEYLTYFPEDRQHIEPYVKTLDHILLQVEFLWEQTQRFETQKDFAMAVKHHPASAVLFHLRKYGGDVKMAWNSQNDSYKVKLLLNEMGVK